jgi:hypothetical protein
MIPMSMPKMKRELEDKGCVFQEYWEFFFGVEQEKIVWFNLIREYQSQNGTICIVIREQCTKRR